MTVESPEFAQKIISISSQNYEVLKTYHLCTEEPIVLKDSEPDKCRFCGRKKSSQESPAITFKKTAHAIPHFIGNRVLISRYECDYCNEKVFSPLESHFSEYMKLSHAIAAVSPGKKYPKIKSKPHEQSNITAVSNQMIEAEFYEGDSLNWTHNESERTLTLTAKRSYTPQNVYRLLVKMGLTIMPEDELGYFKNTLKWLQSKSSQISNSFFLRERVYNTTQFPFISCMIYKRKTNHRDKVPAYLFGLAYSHFFLQIALPFCAADEECYSPGEQLIIPYIPTILDDKRVTCQDVNLSSAERTSNEDISITIGYEYAEKNII